MDTVLRAAAIYALLLVVFRLAGKRALSEATTFDLLLVLVIAETTQQALVGEDRSLMGAAILIVTFVSMDVAMSILKTRSRRMERLLEGTPVTLVVEGTFQRRAMERSRVDEADVLEAARESRGIERLDQIRLAAPGRTGRISIVPVSGAGDGGQGAGAGREGGGR